MFVPQARRSEEMRIWKSLCLLVLPQQLQLEESDAGSNVVTPPPAPAQQPQIEDNMPGNEEQHEAEQQLQPSSQAESEEEPEAVPQERVSATCGAECGVGKTMAAHMLTHTRCPAAVMERWETVAFSQPTEVAAHTTPAGTADSTATARKPMCSSPKTTAPCGQRCRVGDAAATAARSISPSKTSRGRWPKDRDNRAA